MHLKTPSLLRSQAFINGQWIDADNKTKLTVKNPGRGQIIGHVPNMGAAETKAAIESAHRAFPSWSQRPAKERSRILRRWHELILEHIDDLAAIITTEQGKPFPEAQGEIRYGASFVEWFAEEAKRLYGDHLPSSDPNQRLITLKQPVGVVGAITPWNFPSAMITRKCAPALAVGCTVVLKPAEATPFSALALAHLAEQAGFPPGVLNILTGDPAPIGLELTTNPTVRKITFTGSTKIGKLLMAQSAGTVKKISLELGGSAPFLVFADADLHKAAKGLIAAKFRNNGQSCICADRIFVEESIYTPFADALLKEMSHLKVADGFEPGAQLGPLINHSAVEKVERHIADALSKGAILACGGKRHSLGSTFFEPTLLINAQPHMQIAREETFGPVIPLFRFTTEAEAIRMANDTEYGLAAYLYTKDNARIWRVSEQLESGMISVNSGLFSNEMIPFGGIKESGLGREGSKYGAEEFLEMKTLCLAIS